MEKAHVVITGARFKALEKLAKSKQLRTTALVHVIVAAWLENPTKLRIMKRFPAYKMEVEI